VTDPLFLDALHSEFHHILAQTTERRRQRDLKRFQEKLSTLTFLDPACGSGNFLTETYLSLRRLENDVIRERYKDMPFLPGTSPVLVGIGQFHGIEVNDFAVTVATTALWISEAQMLAETERITGHDIDFLPLKTYANITLGNALQTPWPETDYIIGNPPFVGARVMSTEQKQDMADTFGPRWKNVGNMDYVCAWYKRAWEVMRRHPHTRAALVSTNSVTQGEQPALLFKPLFAEGLHIDFARRTFHWDSEATLKAHVHCVIIGFSAAPVSPPIANAGSAGVLARTEALMRAGTPALPALATGGPTIYEGEQVIPARHINAYLTDAPDVFVESRNKPLCDVPEMLFGSMPNDGGHLCGINDEDRARLIAQYPEAEGLLRPFLGAQEYIRGLSRWCLWLKDVSPALIKSIKPIYKAVEGVREVRAASTRASTRAKAATPTLFGEDRQPTTGNYLLVPRVSSERRPYVPIGFMTADVIASDSVQIIPSATLYHFGVLTSSVHMAWMRAVCGRLKSDYRYSKDIVYNNFPWPAPAEGQHEKIGHTAQAILDARALYPDSSLADLYDPLTMPAELRKAHEANDRAVLEAYGLPHAAPEQHILEHLFDRYAALTQKA
ncbi:MAG: class I SAM-dependent DNA methyltransferase, partial [Bacteroidaceae bacterium]|nr:class I SAM-dependent DNA methyltransferase [Bacteroidaceae bacterium]